MVDFKCKNCGLFKELSNFQSFKKSKIYYSKTCKICANLKCREYHVKNRKIILERKNKKYNLNNEKMKLKELSLKKCSHCNINKNISEFGANICKPCVNLKSKLWRQLNSEKYKISTKKCYEKNKLKNKEYRKQYRLNNKEKAKLKYQTNEYRNKRKIYRRNRRIKDPIFRMRSNISNAISRALIKGKSNKAGQSILKFIGYSINDLKVYIEDQFDSNMNWQNYGVYWHIDHIAPQSDFPYISMEDDNFKKCWSLNNLRPLEAKQNMLDGSTRIRHNKL